MICMWTTVNQNHLTVSHSRQLHDPPARAGTCHWWATTPMPIVTTSIRMRGRMMLMVAALVSHCPCHSHECSRRLSHSHHQHHRPPHVHLSQHASYMTNSCPRHLHPCQTSSPIPSLSLYRLASLG
jgi:hypothetical protein